jgi:hypothetical protein
MGLADNPRIVRKLINSRLNGESTRQIATTVGVDHSTVAKALNKPMVKQLLEKAYYDLACLAPEVYTTYADELKAKPASTDDRKIKLQAAREVAGMVGLSPVRDSHNNLFFTQIVAPTTITLNPIVGSMVEKMLSASSGGERGGGERETMGPNLKNFMGACETKPQEEVIDVEVEEANEIK